MSGSVKRQAKVKVLGPLECAIARKMIWRSTCLGGTVTRQPGMGGDITPPNSTSEASTFKLTCKLLHGGQGKDNTLVNLI